MCRFFRMYSRICMRVTSDRVFLGWGLQCSLLAGRWKDSHANVLAASPPSFPCSLFCLWCGFSFMHPSAPVHPCIPAPCLSVQCLILVVSFLQQRWRIFTLCFCEGRRFLPLSLHILLKASLMPLLFHASCRPCAFWSSSWLQLSFAQAHWPGKSATFPMLNEDVFWHSSQLCEQHLRSMNHPMEVCYPCPLYVPRRPVQKYESPVLEV